MQHILSQIFDSQPWAISLSGWRGILACMQDPTWPSARDAHAASAGGGRASAQSLQVAVAGDGRKIGVMRVSGPMVKGVDEKLCEWLGWCSMDSIHAQAARAEAEGINTLVVHLDSPGGMVCGTAEAADRLKELRDKGMHVIAYTDTMACSAAYWLAAACDEVVSSPSAIVGSIGCICMVIDISQMLKEAGVEVNYFVNEGSEAKAYGRLGTAVTDEARAAFQASVNAVGVRFKADVAAGRPGLAMEDMNGGHWGAADAPKGYVDFMSYTDRMGSGRMVRTIGDVVAFLQGL